MTLAGELLREQQELETYRGTWDNHWQEIAEVVLPREANFRQHNEPGEKRTEKVFDSTAIIGLERFAAALESMITPRTQQWHGLEASNPDVQKDREVRLWMEDVTKILFRWRYKTRGNFASQIHENWMSLGAFGTGSIFTDQLDSGGVRYKSIFLGDSYIAQNHQGIVDTYFRKFRITAHAANTKKEWAGRLPKQIAEAKNPYQRFEFLHVVKPRSEVDPFRPDGRGMPWASYYVSVEGQEMLDEGGYRSFPYAISRYVTTNDEVYGRSPAMAALPDIKMLNQMSKTDIRAVHKLVDPPLLLHNDGIFGSGGMNVDMRPGGLTYGGVSSEGRQLIQPLQTGARVDIAEEKMNRRRQTINDAFLVTLFQILVDNPRMTATEALIRLQEKGALITPAMGRQQSEMIGPMIEREIEILQSQGLIPPLPDLLVEARGEYEIIYTSPLSRLQRAEEVTGIQRTLDIIAPFAQIDPSILLAFNPSEIVRIAANVNGVPERAMRSEAEVSRILAQQERDRRQAQQAAIIQPAASAAKDLAQAQAELSVGQQQR